MSFSNFSKFCESFLATSFYYYLMCKFSVVFMGNSWRKILYYDAKLFIQVKNHSLMLNDKLYLELSRGNTMMISLKLWHGLLMGKK